MPQLTVLNNRPEPTPLKPGGGGISGSGGPVGDPEREEIARGLCELLARPGYSGEVRFGRHDRMLYSTDASLYQVEPLGVVVPGDVESAAAVVRWCAQHAVALLPRGGGTSLAGQCTNRAVVLDLTPGCRAVKSLDAAGRWAEVEPGIGIDEFNERADVKAAGLFFAPDPATTRQCAIGGAIGNNAAGSRSVRYGRTSENILAIDAVLATGERVRFEPGAGTRDATAKRLAQGCIDIVRRNAGEIRRLFPRTVRRNAGYGLDMILDQVEAGATAETLDLSKLLCGSEGTLAVTLGARLKLESTPKAKGLAVVSFESVEDAIAAVVPILETRPTAVEMLDDVVLDAARGNTVCRKYVDLLPRRDGREPAAVLYVEYFGFAPGDAAAAEVRAGFEALRRVVGNAPMEAYTDAGAMLKAWALRKAGEPLLHGLAGERKPITFVEDNAVPVERLSEFVREFKKIVARHGTKAAYWAHASVGVLHVRPMIDLHDPADRERMRAIAVEVADLARSVGGIMSGEHGDGRVRGPLLERFFGPQLMGAFRDVKRLFDPAGLLNPGNIVAPGPVESMTESLRVKPALGAKETLHVPDVQTFFDYADAHGFGGAVEQCNGAGVCRKRTGGTMCPSYMATLDERHSTRGRGNALRLAITGQLDGTRSTAAPTGEPNWNDPETIKTLDLCLSCKACKTECPSNVDISRLKAEYTAQRFRQTGGPTLKARVFGHVRALNRLGAIAPGLANAVNRLGPTRWAIERVLGISRRRSIPEFAPALYARFGRSSADLPAPAVDAPTVVFYADCFTTYNDPRIGLASERVLRKLGYKVELRPRSGECSGPSGGCCGRAMISTGLLEDAAHTADATLEALRPAIEDPRVAAIVVAEPSCLSAFKDDWLQLKLRTPIELRRKLAAKAMLVEEFVDAKWNEHPNTSVTTGRAPAQGPAVLLHGHCHQKALWGAETSARLLRRLVGDRLKVLDTGCCGMAGSFGYTTDRYDLSMRIGELGVLPMVRSAGPDAIVVAPGTSCRHQIHDGTGRSVLHPIELAAELL
jgi:FAD/FMN-containing dehydrogenase/Fe-S oxidoreductase